MFHGQSRKREPRPKPPIGTQQQNARSRVLKIVKLAWSHLALSPSFVSGSAGLSAPARMGLRSGAKRLTSFRSFVFHTRKPCCPVMVPTAFSMRWSPELDDSAIAESQAHTPGRGQVFGTHTTPREPESPESLKGVFAPKNDTVQRYTWVGLVQVAAPQLTTSGVSFPASAQTIAPRRAQLMTNRRWRNCGIETTE